jgi:hypothetical protein
MTMKKTQVRRKKPAARPDDARERRYLSEESCPPGWERCADGLCAEVCYLADVES